MATLSSPDAIADALVTAINANAFGGRWPKLNSERTHFLQVDADQLGDIAIHVYPTERQSEPLNRKGNIHTYRVSMAVMKRLDATDPQADADAIRHTAQQVDELIGDGTVLRAGFVWLQNDWQMIVPEILETFNVYCSIITAVFRGV